MRPVGQLNLIEIIDINRPDENETIQNIVILCPIPCKGIPLNIIIIPKTFIRISISFRFLHLLVQSSPFSYARHFDPRALG